MENNRNHVGNFWNTLCSSLTLWHDSSWALAMLTADFCMHQLHGTYRLFVHSCCRPLSTYIPPPSQKCVSIIQRLGLYPPLGRLTNSPSKLRMSWDKAPRTFLLWQPALAGGNPWVSSSIPWRAPGQGMAEKFSCSRGTTSISFNAENGSIFELSSRQER